MNVMQKIITAVRGKVRESAEEVIDANAIRIYEQELIDAKSGLAQAKHKLSLVMAERIQLERNSQTLIKQFEKREQQTREALERGETSLAEELAMAIIETEKILNSQEDSIDQLKQREIKLTQKIQFASQQLQSFSHQLRMIKATENAHCAATMVSSHTGDVTNNISNLQESLIRIKQQQQYFDDVNEAKENLNDHLGEAGLDAKLKKAGIISNQTAIENVLARVNRKD